jgi:hypothetical protein
LARLNLSRPEFLGAVLVVAALAAAGCGKHGSTVTPTPTSTPTTPGASAKPCTLTLGYAYEPDGGTSTTSGAIQVVHFEDNNEDLCNVSPVSTPIAVGFSSSVGPLAFSPDLSAGLALVNSSTGYSLAQVINGAGSLVGVGTPYNLAVAPSPVPSASATPPVPLIGAGSSVTVIGSTTASLALIAGPDSTPAGLVALNQISFPPPQYASRVPFSGVTYTYTGTLPGPYSIARANSTGATLLVRGPADLAAFSVGIVGAGYQFNAQADDKTLGYGSALTLRGNGNIAFDPANAARALIGGSTSGNNSQLTLITGLPDAITIAATTTVPGNIRSIVIAPNGTYAVVGTDQGIVVVNGVNGTALTIVTPFAPLNGSASLSGLSYTNCLAVKSTLTNIYSVALSSSVVPSSSTAYYLVALGTAPGLSCPSGYDASLVAVPFNTSTGALASPAPTPSPSPSASPAATPPPVFVQNNIVAPPAGADYLFVH